MRNRARPQSVRSRSDCRVQTVRYSVQIGVEQVREHQVIASLTDHECCQLVARDSGEGGRMRSHDLGVPLNSLIRVAESSRRARHVAIPHVVAEPG